MTPGGEDYRFDWRRGGAAAGALLAVLMLLGLVYLVAASNQRRDDAMEMERRAYDVTLLTTSIDGSISRAEAGLGQFALDEDVKTSGNIYYSYWRLAGRQMEQLKSLVRSDPKQVQRVEELQRLYGELGAKFDQAARVITAKQGDTGIRYYYGAVREPAE